MRVSRRFQIAVHTILFIAKYEETEVLTSEKISEKMNYNPVVIKNILNILHKNDLLSKSKINCGFKLKKDIKDITLWDIYKITDEVNISQVFDDDLQISNSVVPDLSELLSPHFQEILSFIEDTLSKVSIETLLFQYNYNE